MTQESAEARGRQLIREAEERARREGREVWGELEIPFELNGEWWRTDRETASLLRSLFNDDMLEAFQAVFLLGKHSGRIVATEG